MKLVAPMNVSLKGRIKNGKLHTSAEVLNVRCDDGFCYVETERLNSIHLLRKLFGFKKDETSMDEDDLSEMTVAELRELAKEHDISLTGVSLKADIIEVLDAAL